MILFNTNRYCFTDQTSPMSMLTELYTFLATSSLISPVYKLTTAACFSFYFRLQSASINLNVVANDNGNYLVSKMFGLEETPKEVVQ